MALREIIVEPTEARPKKSDSGVAGGVNMASRVAAFFYTFLGGKKILSIFANFFFFLQKLQKKFPVITFVFTRPLHQKHNFYLVWP